ncbi:MAG: Gfo/Idh/MocA family oxidoreductase [Actinomycetia bacterium]|nr:Gfo/Idh/MocA family oxidoreductase [Actinomycetes bacterium]
MTVGVGVIGVGNIGTAHARNLAGSVAGSTVSAVFDVSRERSAELAAELGCRSASSADELIGGDDVDAVVIASPDALHPGQALACLAAGKPTLCEKPLAPTQAEAQVVLDAEVALGRRLITLGFMRRFDPGYLGLKDEILTGAIGAPLLVHNVHRVAYAPYGLTSTGTVAAAAIHEIDINRWLLDDEYERVQIISGRPGPDVPDGERDPMLLIFQTVTGVLVEVEVFLTARYGYEVVCQVVASDGVADMGDRTYITRTTKRVRGQAIPEQWLGRFNEAYRLEAQAWVDSIRGLTGPVGASLWDGFAATVAAEAAITSLSSERWETVDLPPKPDLYA